MAQLWSMSSWYWAAAEAMSCCLRRVTATSGAVGLVRVLTSMKMRYQPSLAMMSISALWADQLVSRMV